MSPHSTATMAQPSNSRMSGLASPEASQPLYVEVSGWDASQNVFVEAALWRPINNEAARLHISQRVGVGDLVYIRAAGADSPCHQFPVAYEVCEFGARRADGTREIRVTRCTTSSQRGA